MNTASRPRPLSVVASARSLDDQQRLSDLIGVIYDAAIDLCQRLNIPLPLLTAPAAGNREEETVATGSNTCTIP